MLLDMQAKQIPDKNQPSLGGADFLEKFRKLNRDFFLI